jgi:hypothetical protein
VSAQRAYVTNSARGEISLACIAIRASSPIVLWFGGRCVKPSRGRATTKQQRMNPTTTQIPVSDEAKVRLPPLLHPALPNSTATLFRISTHRISTHAQRGLNSHGISIPPFAYTSKPATLSSMSAAPSHMLTPRNRLVKTRLALWNGQS